MIGTRVGSYRIVSKLSVGGMGTVYRAEHELIGKLAAVKVLRPELCTNQEIVARFFNEAKSTTAIKHPGIVEIFDFGYMESGHAYLTMEFLEGMTLAERCEARGKMSEGEAAMLLRGVCSALAAAHAKGIVHRDLKPDNIFMVPDPDSATGERPKILDFGIAKLTDSGLAGSVSATKTGAVMGTPTYMSPEQCKGTADIDHRADLYSIGCIFYELVTGRPPFTELSAGELIGAHLFIEPVPPSTLEPGLSAETESLVMALLNKQPAKRPQTARELSQRFAQIAQRQGWITHTSPVGVTAQSLSDLPAVIRTPVPGDTRLGTGDARPPTPMRSTPAPVFTPAPFDTPTTLSGAASQTHDVPTKSRKGLVIVLAATVMLAAGTVTFIKVSGRSETKAEVTPAKSEVAPAKLVMPPPDPTPNLETPTPTVKADPIPAPPVVADPPPAVQADPTPAAKPEVAATKPAVATKPVVAIKKKPVAVVKPATPTKKPPEKKKPSLIETDID